MSQDVNVSWDDFFYYGKQDIRIENQNDLWIGILNDSRIYLYNRQDSVGIQENLPIGFASYLLLRYNITKWVAYRNSYVVNGKNNTKDRRIAASQDSIDVKFPDQNKYSGKIDLSLLYYNFFDLENPQKTNSVFGG
jgi:hypothetical protein